MRFAIIYLTLLLCAACAPQTLSTSTDQAVAPTSVADRSASDATVAPPTATATATAAPTLPPPPMATSEPTQTPVPTAAPTEAPTATATMAATATAMPSPTATVEGACPPLSEVESSPVIYRPVAPPWPRGAPYNGEIFYGVAGDRLIHLGFDVEGDPAHLGDILDVLDRRGVKTTMFILGTWAEQYPDWIREMSRRGHEFANHAYSHSNMKDMDAELIRQELESTERIVQQLSGQTTKPYFRPPFGSRSEASVQAAYDAGWSTVIWTSSTEDWRSEFDADDMCRTLRAGAYPGGILYTHTHRPEIPEVIDRFIGTMQLEGYTFVPLSIILSDSPYNTLIKEP